MFEQLKARATGELRFENVKGKTVITSAYSRYPIKFVSATRACEGGCAWVYTLGYGGGAVCGDNVTVRCNLGHDCTAALTTQGSTKVFKRGTRRGTDPGSLGSESDFQRAAQSLNARVSRGALLAVVPDPVTCFEDSSFRQHQRFLLEQGASLILVDWITSGRMSRGEGWAFSRLESRNEIMLETRARAEPEQSDSWEPLVVDALVLEDLPGLSIRDRMLGMNVVGVVILAGPRVDGAVSTLLEREARKRSRFPPGLEEPARSKEAEAPRRVAKGKEALGQRLEKVRRRKVLSSVSPLEVSGGDPKRRGLVFRFAAEQTEDAREMLHEFLMPLQEDLGGRAPYSRDGHCCYYGGRK